MNKKTKLKKVVGTIAILQIVTYLFTGVVEAKVDSYDYSNPIYQNGLEDTYFFETNDSVVTTKTQIKRTLPKTFGKFLREEYPIPNVSKPGSEAKFNEILQENIEIMDQVEENIKNGTLKKHVAADGQFYGTVSDDALAIEKIAYINSNLKGSHSLAVYVPAGEIATVTIPEEYVPLAKEGKLSIRVGMTETNADSYSKNNGNENRMPRLGKSFQITETTTKVGTPFGGMIYLFLTTNTVDGLTIPVTVSGAVDSPYYDFGSTTKQEWDISKNAPGIYAEFRTPYVRFMMPASTIRNIEDPYDILSFWTNVSSLSTYPFGASTRTLPVTMVFDPYVKAGAAVATVGAWICNMPTGWANSSLNYEGYVANGGWGTIHEFNHHWQGTYNSTGRWGVGDVGEVTNNVMNAASYILYTNVAASRTENGLEGWNYVSDPYSNLKNVLNDSKNNPNNTITAVYMYVSFMHEFGVQNYLEVIKSNYYGGTYHGVTIKSYDPNDSRYDDLAYRTSVVLGKDLSYYFKDVLHFELSSQTIEKIKALGFENYIPVENLYAVGPKGVETGRPFYIPNTNYTFDFSKYMQTSGDFEVVSVSDPTYGSMAKNADGTYTYVPKQNIPQNAIDTFELTVKVSVNGITQNRVLVCKIGFNFNGSKIEKYQIDEEDTSKAIEQSKVLQPYATTYNTNVNYTTDIGYNFTKATGYFVAPEDGSYEFQAYGDDRIQFVLSSGGKEYSSQTKTYTANVTAAYNNTGSTHFTISLNKGEIYSYTLYTNNRGGNGGGYVACRKQNDANWSKLPAPYLNKEDVGKTTDKNFKQPKPYYTRPITKLTNTILVDDSKAKILSTPIKQVGDGNQAESILDHDRNTFFHSAYSGKTTPFPHDYVIDLGEEKTFNRVDIYTRANNTNGTIGDYMISVASSYQEGETQWSEIASDKTRYQNTSAPNTISKSVLETTARYIKLSALNNKNGNNFTIVADLELSNETKIISKIAQNSSMIYYQGNWERKTQGNYINGATYTSKDGFLGYGFTGTQTAIYSLSDAVMQARVDNTTWKTYTVKGNKYSPSTILKGLSEGDHTIEIKVISGELGVNLLTTDGIFIPYKKIEDPKPEALTITSDTYTIMENYMTKIEPKTNIQTFKSFIKTNAKTIEIIDKKGNVVDSGEIATGMILKLNGEEKRITLIVTADINGDGKATATDLLLLKRHLVAGSKTEWILTNEVYMAGDINGDGSITATDLLQIKRIVLKNI